MNKGESAIAFKEEELAHLLTLRDRPEDRGTDEQYEQLVQEVKEELAELKEQAHG